MVNDVCYSFHFVLIAVSILLSRLTSLVTLVSCVLANFILEQHSCTLRSETIQANILIFSVALLSAKQRFQVQEPRHAVATGFHRGRHVVLDSPGHWPSGNGDSALSKRGWPMLQSCAMHVAMILDRANLSAARFGNDPELIYIVS